MLILSVAAGQAFPAQSPSPLDILRRAMEADTHTTYSAIRLVSTFEGRGFGLRIKKDQDSSGASATLVLAPTWMQGRITIDDGKKLSTYNPERKTLFVQDSPVRMLDKGEWDRRIALIKQNYRVSDPEPCTYAGRRSVRISISPNEKGMLFTRCFWVDSDRNVMLRVDWVHPSGKRKTISDTLTISYPEKLPDDVLKLKLMETPKQVRIQSPRTERSISSLSKHVGFDVLLPLDMPLGFLFTRAEAVSGATRTMAALRFTDGASNVTIYQAQGVDGKPPWRVDARRGDFEHNGLFFAVEGDVPEAARAKFIEAVRQNNGESEAAFRQKAAKLMAAPERLVADLRDLGLRFGDVVMCLAVSKSDPRKAMEAAWLVRKGRSIEEISEKFGVRESDIRKTVKQFWTNT